MCCFSGPVESVADTRIFARFVGERKQVVVYQMTYAAKAPLAMILPIPTPPKSPDDAVEFVNLEDYEALFDDLKAGFPVKPPRGAPGGTFGLGGVGAAADVPLAVEDVGAFVASFVPSVADFGRLDKQFRLGDDVWQKLPQYKDYGFAVFQLKPEAKTVHPMAFKFPTRPRAGLFLPTVHIHDGKVHEQAAFDHDLYIQLPDMMTRMPRGWTESPALASEFVEIERTKGLVAKDQHCYRLKLKGKLKNQDTWV